MTDKETTYLIVMIVLAVCLFVSLIFNVFFLIDMYYHIWCYGRKRRHYRRHHDQSDSDSCSDEEVPAAPRSTHAVVTGSRRHSRASVVMLAGDRQGEEL